MDQERNLGTARAFDTTGASSGTEQNRQEVQQAAEQVRESVAQTAAEIRDTAADQYESAREAISGGIDWRGQARQRPVAFSLGAFAVGILVGYGIAGAMKRGRSSSSFSQGGGAATGTAQPDQPGVLDKLTNSQAFNRLQAEASQIATQFVDELSNTAKNDLLPAMRNKVEEAVGTPATGEQQGQSGSVQSTSTSA